FYHYDFIITISGIGTPLAHTFPVATFEGVRQYKRHRHSKCRQQFTELFPAPAEWLLAYVFTLPFQQVKTNHHEWRRLTYFRTERLSSDTCLHHCKRQRSSILPGNYLSVQHGAGRQ